MKEAAEPYLDECYDSKGYFVGYLPPTFSKVYPEEVLSQSDPACFNYRDQIHYQDNLEYINNPKYYELPGLAEIRHDIDYDHSSIITSSKGTRKKKKRHPMKNALRYADGLMTPCHEWEDIAYTQVEIEPQEVYSQEVGESQICSTNLIQVVKSEPSVKESITSKKTTSDRGCGSQRSLLLRNFKECLEADPPEVIVEILMPIKKCMNETDHEKESLDGVKLEAEKVLDTNVSVIPDTKEEVFKELSKVEKDYFDSEPSILQDDDCETIPGTPCLFRSLMKIRECGDDLPHNLESEIKPTADEKNDDIIVVDLQKVEINSSVSQERTAILEKETPLTTTADEPHGEAKETDCYDSPRTENQSMFSAMSNPNKKVEDSDETLSNHEQDAVITNYNNLLKYSAEYQGNLIKQWLDSFVKQSYTLGFKEPVRRTEPNIKNIEYYNDKITQFPDHDDNIKAMKSLEHKEDYPREKVKEFCKICPRCMEKRRTKCRRCVYSSNQLDEGKYEWLKKYPIDCIYLKITKANGEHSFINPITKQEFKIYPMKDMKLHNASANQDKDVSSADATDAILERHKLFLQKKTSRKRFTFPRRVTADGSSISISGANSIYSTEERQSASSGTDGTYILEKTPNPTG